MTRTVLFKSNKSQAVRLPKAVAFPNHVKAVSILKEGQRRVIVPAVSSWDDFFDDPGLDIPEREQPNLQVREEL